MSGTVQNQVQRVFNGYGQVTSEYQDVDGAVVVGTTPRVQYAYSTPSDTVNHSRLNTLTYPNGRVLTYNYVTGLSADLSRVASLVWAGTTVESLAYLGLGTVVRRDHLESNANLIYVKMSGEANGAAGDQYTGLDRFGRVIDQRWEQGASGHADRFQYAYDRDSNRLYADNLLNNAYDQLYHADGATAGYDLLNRLMEWQRGALSDTNSDGILDTVTTANRSQVFTLDAQGNFGTVNTDGTGTNRTHNAQNEIQTVGAASLTYDNNGNLTTDELGQKLKYDAWNRLERVYQSNGTTLINLYGTDALGRRVYEDPGLRRDFYYSLNWQLLEERLGNLAQVQTVYSPVYVDALVVRDRDVARDGVFEERLYVTQDANWNVTSLITTGNVVVERYAYDVYGVRTALDGTWAVRGASAYAFNFGFQGRWHDALTGNIESRNRWERPTLQVWLQRDLIYTSTNWYAAYGNNPVNRLDPMGLESSAYVWSYTKGFSRSATLQDIAAMPVKLGYDVVRKPTVDGPRGAAHHEVRWTISPAICGVDGFIIQHIEVTGKARESTTSLMEFSPKKDFFEAWQVVDGKVYDDYSTAKKRWFFEFAPAQQDTDTFKIVNLPKGTSGTHFIRAEAKFFRNYELNPAHGWSRTAVTEAGGLMATEAGNFPDWSVSKIPSLLRVFMVWWDDSVNPPVETKILSIP